MKSINKELWLKAFMEFNQERFFLCHETLEDYWLSEDDPEHKDLMQGIIHIAAAYHHNQRQNAIGYERQIEKGMKKLAGVRLDVYGKILNADLAGFYQNMVLQGKTVCAPKIRLTGSEALQ